MITFDARRLVFVLGPPRAGTTLLMRLLHAHPDMEGGPEPHLLTPLAHLGVPHHVEKAAYDPFVTAEAIRGLVARIGDDTWYRALRALSDVVYGDLAERSGKRLLVDKTPAYSLIWPFLVRLYPEATFVVITRHPGAVFSSYADSFFEGDWEVAHRHNPILERYIPALAGLLRSSQVERRIHVQYEHLVRDPHTTLQHICTVAGVEFFPDMVEYGRIPVAEGAGDPVTVDRASRPVDGGVDAWAIEVARRPERRAHLERMVATLDDADLALWGTPRSEFWKPVDQARPGERRRRPWDRYRLQRAVLLAARSNLGRFGLRSPLRRLRFMLDVVLRE
jgi:hypothetical protein